MVGEKDRRSAIKMNAQTKLKFQSLKSKYEELTGEVLTEEEFLNILMNAFEKNEQLIRFACLDNMIEEFISKLKSLLSDHPRTMRQLFELYQGLQNDYNKLKKEYERLKAENEELKAKISEIKESKSVDIMTPRELFYAMINKTIESIDNEELKKEVERDLTYLSMILFSGDNINPAKLKSVIEAVNTMKISPY